MKKKCLLIGGAGFIGANLGVCLSKSGYDVTICDCVEKEALSQELLELEYVRLDYFTELIEDSVISAQDMIILLISSVGPNSSMVNCEQCYSNDITRMIGLLEQMKRCYVDRLVFISSGGTVYGNQNLSKMTENMETFPINHYGIMKLTQEKILLMYNELYGMKNVVFRLANPYGPGQRISSGIGAITAFLHAILEEKVIHIYGEGQVVRDYIYIKDAVNMIELFFEKETAEDKVPIYNIGTGKGTSIIEILKIIEAVTGKKAEIEFLQNRKIDVERNVLDISKICSVIGKYHCLSVQEGVNLYYNYLCEKNLLSIG